MIQPTDREKADAFAIGGLRNSADSVRRLGFTADFGIAMGKDIRSALLANLEQYRSMQKPQDAWIAKTCICIGSEDHTLRPPPEAVDAIRDIIRKHTRQCTPDDSYSHPTRTNIHAWLLESWRVAAKDPDDQIYTWLTQGAPAGILHAPKDPGIFPDCSAPSEMEPGDLQCDASTFTNYYGVEDKEVTTTEMQTHIDSEHLAEFDTFEELENFVGGKPILNKLGRH